MTRNEWQAAALEALRKQAGPCQDPDAVEEYEWEHCFQDGLTPQAAADLVQGNYESDCTPDGECAYCGRDGVDDSRPKDGDKEAWMRVMAEHEPDCEWVAGNAPEPAAGGMQ